MNPVPEESLDELLLRYQRGSLSAFESFFQRSKGPLYSFIRRRIRSREAAEDVLQDCYLRVHRYLLSYRPSEGKAITWLFRIAQNCIHDARQKQFFPQEPFLAESTENKADEKLFLNEMLEALGVEDSERDLLVDRFILGLSFEEIVAKENAPSEGVRVDAVRQKMSRLLKRLRAWKPS